MDGSRFNSFVLRASRGGTFICNTPPNLVVQVIYMKSKMVGDIQQGMVSKYAYASGCYV
jgi:hypothetical protein